VGDTLGLETMTEKSASTRELAVGLPLDVIANKLMRIEADLRLLNMKALVLANDHDRRLTGLIEARLEAIFAALDSIRSLASDIEVDIQPRSSAVSGTPTKVDPSLIETPPAMGDIHLSPDVVYSGYASRKPEPDRDD
jgi:hypothetical protein